jgi:phosphate transport system ATP-binding protein
MTTVSGSAIDIANLGRRPAEPLDTAAIAFTVERLCLEYERRTQALQDIFLTIPKQRVTAFIGPSGCGKSSLLRCFNRMNELLPDCRVKGRVLLEGEDIYARGVDVTHLRRRVGMVFQTPNPFPKSIFENVAFGLRLQGIHRKRQIEEVVEKSLQAAALWSEVKDRLHANALTLSGGQQQRLVIARALAVEPEVLLLDEPASALDPISTLRIEELIYELKARYTIIIVTHNMQQAARVSDMTAFMDMGRLIEYDSTDRLFTNPRYRQTEDYITGRYG